MSDKSTGVTAEVIPGTERAGATGMDIPVMFDQAFASWAKIVLRDLNSRRQKKETFYKYSRDRIQTFLKDPESNEKELRHAVVYLYSASPHFRRIIQYFVSLSDLSFVISPYRIDSTTAKKKTVLNQYNRVKNLLSIMDIPATFPKILTVCLREDTFFGTIRVAKDSISIQQLPSDLCKISSIEGNVFNVSFDFDYFNRYEEELENYPEEFKRRFREYKEESAPRYQELDSPFSFAVKVNAETPTYSVPPFVGILREIYDIEDYKDLKMSRTEIENYALLVMKLGMTNGSYDMDYQKAVDFWSNLSSELPEQVGSVLSPMEINKISFERTGVGDADTVAEAEERLFSAAGVSSLLFNNEKAAASALALSINSDQAITYGIVKSIESVINRYIRTLSYGKSFRIRFLDCSWFNRKELSNEYLKACQYGVPMVSYYCAAQGMPQADMDGLSFLENDVLQIKEKFVPLQSSATQSKKEIGNEGGRPKKDDRDLTESGEEERDRQ